MVYEIDLRKFAEDVDERLLHATRPLRNIIAALCMHQAETADRIADLTRVSRAMAPAEWRRIDAEKATRIALNVMPAPGVPTMNLLENTSEGLLTALRKLAGNYGPAGVQQVVNAMMESPASWELVPQDEPVIEFVREPTFTFEQNLSRLINYHSMENGSNTPDFLLARFMSMVLDAFSLVACERDTWYGHKTMADNDEPLAAPLLVAPAPTPERSQLVWIVAETLPDCLELARLHHVDAKLARYIYDDETAERMRGFLLPFNAEELGMLIVSIWPSDSVRNAVQFAMKLPPRPMPDVEPF